MLADTRRRDVQRQLAGLDQLELAEEPRPSRARRVFAAAWPKVVAIGLALLVWQSVLWLGIKEEYELAPPSHAFPALAELWGDGILQDAIVRTLSRASVGFALALAIGVTLGAVVSSSRVLRSGVGALITGLQTMPSVAWFPLAILLFGFDENAIRFVIVLGAAPSIANGLIGGIDHVPPILLRAGRVLGAKGLSRWRHVVLPAAFPSFLGGLKQGWAFSWRSLMAGELLVPLGQSVGGLLQQSRDLHQVDRLMGMMVVVLVIGILVDALLFGGVERWVRRRWGLDAT